MIDNAMGNIAVRQTRNASRRTILPAVLCLALCASLYGVSVVAAAQGAAILYDQGPTRPLSDYVESMVPLSAAFLSARPPLPSKPSSQMSSQAANPHNAQNPQALNPPNQSNAQPLNRAIPSPVYPVDTPSLNPGPVEPRRVQLHQLASAPFFLIGNDPLSRDWLAHYSVRLAALGAAGFLVKAESDAELQSIRQLAPGIPVTPLDATQLAKTLGLTHYPVLVTAGLIEQ